MYPPSGRAVPADGLPVPLAGQPAAVMYQEAARAGELVLLLRQHLDGQLLAGQVGARQLERLVQLGLVDVDRAGLRLGPTRLQLLEGVLAQLVYFCSPGGVVVGCHLLFLLTMCGW